MWWSGDDQDWADNRLTRAIDVPTGTDVRFSMWNDYVIEEDWDYGFVEVSTDGGTTWAEQKVYAADGTEVSTPDGYADPNGRMVDYGNKKYGLTGHTDGMEQQYVDLTPYAGQAIQLRLLYATDEAFVERGWFADDFSVTGGGATTWTDDVEGADNNGWEPVVASFTDTTGAGWHKDPGTQVKSHYYLVEWRNYDGFDRGLQYAYDTTYQTDAWKVEKIRYNAPGALVWYRDTTWGSVNHVNTTSTQLPSGGSKGGLLIVDSHFDPLRRTGEAAALDGSTLKNLPSRPQSSNAAFGLQPTKAFQECLTDAAVTVEKCTSFAPQAGVGSFTDAKTWYPGLEFRNGGYFWRDQDASAVVPSQGNAPYTTRIVDAEGNPAEDHYGLNFGFTTTGTGNPADSGVAFDTVVEVVKAMSGNMSALVRVVPPAG
jgi:immune inhibitor A